MRAAVCAGAGVLYALAQVGYGLWPFVFVCLALWWGALGARLGPGRAFALSGLFGASAYAVAMPWLLGGATHLVDGRGGLAFGLWILYGLWIAAGFALVGLGLVFASRGGTPVWLAGPLSLVAVEWLQPRIFAANVGEALATAPALAQIAELGGPLALSAFVALVNGLLLEAFRRLISDGGGGRGGVGHGGASWMRGGVGHAGAALGLVVLVAAGGLWRMRSWPVAPVGDGIADAVAGPVAQASADFETLRPLAIGLVQANLSLAEKRDDAGPGHARHLEQTRALLAEGPLDLVVWPETAYARALRRPLPLDAQPVRAELRVPLLFGASSVLERAGRRASTNSVFLAEASGRIEQVYDKHLLVPFAETDPFARLGGAALRDWMPRGTRFHPGEILSTIRLGPVRIATPVCYEVTVASFVRRLVRAGGANLIVTLANDAWFGRTREPRMHLALARLRAIEHRLWLVRATNSGYSGIVDPAGRLVGRSALFEQAGMRAVVWPRPAETLYGRLGDWPGPLALVGLLGAGLVGATRREGPGRIARQAVAAT